MPKIKDLGINIVPAGMRPPEIGGGGGYGCDETCTPPSFPPVPTDPGCVCITAFPPHYGNYGMNQSDAGCQCITQRYPCGGSHHGGYNQSDAGCQCITQPGPCGGMTAQCGGMTGQCPGGSQCTVGSITITITPLTPQLPAGALTRDDIAALRAQLKQHLDNVDVAEKSLLPKTLEEVDAREKALQAEMDQLKARRAELKK